MKRLLPIALLVAAIAVWWLWPQDVKRAQKTQTRAERVETSGAAAVPAAVVPPRAKPGVGTIYGVVRSSDGVVSGARIRLHRAEEKVAFDECVTAADGSYRLDAKVDADGESLDLRIEPRERSGLRSRVARYLVVKPGVSLELDFVLKRSRTLKVVAVDAPTSDPLDFALMPEKTWLELVAGSIDGHPEWITVRKAATTVIKRRAPFQFTRVSEEFQVVVCVTAGYWTPDPRRVRGGDEITVVVKRLVGFIVQVFDAATGKAVPHAKTVRRMANEPDVAANGPGTGFRLGHVLGTHVPATIRIESGGYYPLERQLPVTMLQPRPRSFFLVPRSSPTLTVRGAGPGAREFLEGVELTATGERGRRSIWTDLPPRNRTSSSAQFAIPAGSWAIHIHHARFPLQQSGNIVVEGGRDRSLSLEVPDFATLKIETPQIPEKFLFQAELRSAQLHWEQVDPGRLAWRAVPSTEGHVKLRREAIRRRSFLLLPGKSELRWQRVSRTAKLPKRNKKFDLEPGAHTKLVLD